jgi:hypothetical protein
MEENMAEEKKKKEKKEVICKVCGKSQKFMTHAHLATHNINKEQYEMMPDFVPEEIDEFSEMSDEVTITQAEVNRRIFGDQERDINRPLKDFLNEFGVTETELRELVRKYTTGKKIDPKIQAERDITHGIEGAQKFLDKDYVETPDLHIAEALSNQGFTVTEVRKARGDTKKMWVLKKNV